MNYTGISIEAFLLLPTGRHCARYASLEPPPRARPHDIAAPTARVSLPPGTPTQPPEHDEPAQIPPAWTELRARHVPDAPRPVCVVRAEPEPRHARRHLLDAVLPDSTVALRFSGELVARLEAYDAVRMPCLRHVTPHGVTGSYFDRHPVDRCFPDAHLESFLHALRVRNHHLESLAASYGPRLRKLVRLGCSRLSSTVITQCL
ncbi:hypothetical protein BD310DRAFT_939694 [Dichomitus squalens]|uniref:Uncharacterized protein n=1 Tax=Dichomitus squalens TaxID=114155 RepID=A0A4V2K6M2_9APHY|nr:hypothetical protein BD310DRAFT_939694 [Dichomitus squalens]